MVRLARILRDYSDAGRVNTLLPLWGFVDGETFMTKAGHVGFVYSLRGVDVDGLTQAQRRIREKHLQGSSDWTAWALIVGSASMPKRARNQM